MGFIFLIVEQMLLNMICLSLNTSNEKWWYYPLVVLVVILIMAWYFVNMKRASARNTYISPKKYELADVREGELYLLTYNVAGLPEPLSSAKLPRAESITAIGWKLDRFDIVNVQEDFNYNSSLYSYNQHPFRTDTKGKVPFGDGLNTLSKYPILELHRVPWSDCSGTDCLTPKGFAHMRLQLAKEVFIDVYNLHATAQSNRRAVEARKKNIQQLVDYINEHSQDVPLLVMGDFNAHYSFVGDNLHAFKKQTNAVDPWVDFFLEGVIPEPVAEFMIPKKLEITDEIESIDKILYRNSANLKFIPQSYAIEDKLFSTEDNQHLSDHLAVSLRVAWTCENSM